MQLIYLFLNPITITKFLQLLRSNENRKHPIDMKRRKITFLDIFFYNYDYFLLAAVISFLLRDTEMYHYLQFNVIFFTLVLLTAFLKLALNPFMCLLWGFLSFVCLVFFLYVRKSTNSTCSYFFSFPLFFSDAFLNLRLSFE